MLLGALMHFIAQLVQEHLMSLLLVALLIYFGFFFYVRHCVVLFDFPSVFFEFFAGHDWDVSEHGLDLGIPLLILFICSGMLLPQV